MCWIVLPLGLVVTPGEAQGRGRVSVPVVQWVAAKGQSKDNLRHNVAAMRADMAAETRRHHAGTGAVIGGIVGLAVGVWLGDKARTSCEGNCGALVPAAGAAGALLGAGSGALIGWALKKG